MRRKEIARILIFLNLKQVLTRGDGVDSVLTGGERFDWREGERGRPGVLV
jgi:hypothetical protein